MKDFSRSWKSSTQPRKQRKYRFKAPLHIKGRMLHSHLSKELRKKYSRRSLRPRKGDKVRIARGQFAKREGKISRVDVKLMKVFIENVDMTKKDGSKSFYPLDPSNLILLELAEDKMRQVKK